jgi:hypothetical protein
MILPVNPPKNVTIEPAIPAEIINDVSEVDIVTISDNTVSEVSAVINIRGIDKVYILWEGQAYIDIGDWTQAQANARILELI